MTMKRQPTNIDNVFRYPNGMLYYRGRGIEESLQTTDEKEAKLRKVVLEDRLLKYGFNSFKLTFGGLEPAFMKHLDERLAGKSHHVKKLRKNSHRFYVSQYKNHIVPYFGKMKLSKFDEFAWRKYIEDTGRYDYSGQRIAMGVFLKWAKSQRYVNRSFDLEIPTVERRERQIATGAQLLYIAEHTTGNLFDFTTIAMYCGKRGGEVRTLKWSDIDFQRNCLMLREENVKTKKAREIPFNAAVRAILLRRLAMIKRKQVKTEFVFYSRYNHKRPMNDNCFCKLWLDFKKKHPKVENLTLHDLRATFETALNKRTDFTDTQKEKYVGASMEMQKSIYVKFKAEDLKGIEHVLQVPGLHALIVDKSKTIQKI